MILKRFGGPLGAVLGILALAACGEAGAEEQWPLSELESVRDSVASGVGAAEGERADATGPSDATEGASGSAASGDGASGAASPGTGAPGGAADPGSRASEAGSEEGTGGGASVGTGYRRPSDRLPELGMGSDAVDMERSGPMIHTRPTEVDTVFPGARFPRPEHVRGLYVNAWAAGSTMRMEALLDLARRTEINSFVIDIKDATGYVSHATEVPLAHEIGATGERRIRDLPALLDRLEAEGIYPIARIVVIKDPLLATTRPEMAIQDTAGGVWIDSKDFIWLNPWEKGVWDYHVELAREVAEMGFPEIQWDYIRFPDAPESDMARAVFPGSGGRPRVEAIRGFLSYARDSLSDLPVRSTADVFGVTTSFGRDIGLGQLWESFIDVVDVALPMVYPSHYWEGSFGYVDPNAYPYEVVYEALRHALRRSSEVAGAGLTRPWIQDFTLGQPIYGAPEVRAQIQAAYDLGIQEWILWNPSTRYSEGALEPVDGFEREPLVRVAGVLTPVSRRHVVMDSVAALPPPPPDSLDPLGVAGDSSIAVDTAVVLDSAAIVDTAVTADSVTAEDAVIGVDTAGTADTIVADSLDSTPAPFPPR